MVDSLLGASQPLFFTGVIFVLFPLLAMNVMERSHPNRIFIKLQIEDDFFLKFILMAISTRIFLHFLHFFLAGKIVALCVVSFCIFMIITSLIRHDCRHNSVKVLKNISSLSLIAFLFLFLVTFSYVSNKYYVIEGSNHDLQYFYEATHWFSNSSILNLNSDLFFQNASAISEFSGPASNFSRTGIFSEISYLWPIETLTRPIYTYLAIAIGIVYYFFAIKLIRKTTSDVKSITSSSNFTPEILQTFLLVLTPPSLLMLSNANIGSFIVGSLLCLNMALLICRPIKQVQIHIALNLALVMHLYPEVAIIQIGILAIFALYARSKRDKSKLSIKRMATPVVVFMMGSNISLYNGIQSWISALNTGPNVSSPTFFLYKPYFWLFSSFATVSLNHRPIIYNWQLIFVITLFLSVSIIIWKSVTLRLPFAAILSMSIILFAYALMSKQQYFEIKIIQYLGILVWFLLISRVFCIFRRNTRKSLDYISIVSATIICISSFFLVMQDFKYFLNKSSMKKQYFSLLKEQSIKSKKIIFDDSMINSQQEFQSINYLITELVLSSNEVFMPVLNYNPFRGAYFNKKVNGKLSLSMDEGELISIRKENNLKKFVNNRFEETRTSGDLALSSFGENSHFVLFGSGFQSCDRNSCSFSKILELLFFVGKSSPASSIRLYMNSMGNGGICQIELPNNRNQSCVVNGRVIDAPLSAGWNKLIFTEGVEPVDMYRIRKLLFMVK